jgi:ABC-2 type transport system ATP-binding protein
MLPLIVAETLHKSFGPVHAVDGVTVRVQPGEIYGLVGPDGAGKTTFIRLLVGALALDGGSVQLAGYDLARQTAEAREQIGYLAQRFALYEDLTVLENLQFFAEVRGLPTRLWKPRSQEILDFVGLLSFANRRAGQLSGGMKQKLGLALALVNRPKILLLDEPTTGVDPATRQDFWRLIIPLLKSTELAVLPYMDEAVRCQRIGFLRSGRIIAEGSPHDLRNRLAGQILELAGEPLALLAQVAGADPAVEAVQRFGNRFHLRVQPGAAEMVCGRLASAVGAAGGQVRRLAVIEPSLEDLFISLADQAGHPVHDLPAAGAP